MEFAFGPEERVFRATVRAFFGENPPPAGGRMSEGASRESRAYRRLLGERGWLTMHWPKQYGGQGASANQQVIFKEECFCAGVDAGGAGVNLIGPTLMLHGTEEQKAEHLP